MDEDTGLIRSSVAYPFAGAASTRLVFGAVLYFFGAVVSAGAIAIAVRSIDSPPRAVAAFAVGLLALLPIFGYAAATVRSVLDDDPEPPAFGDLGSLVRDGRRLAIVLLSYALPIAAAGAGAVLLYGGGGLDGGSMDAASLALVAIAGALAILAAYVLPAAVVAVVYDGATSTAWDVATLREAVVDGRYASGWIVAATIALAGGAIGSVSAPFVVGFAVLFATQTAATYAVTRGVIASLDLTLEEPPAPPASGYVPGWDDGPQRKKLSQGRLGGSLLPTTPDADGDDGEIDRDQPGGTPGPLAPTGGGDDGPSDLDRPGDAPSVGDAAGGSDPESSGDDVGSDIAPFADGDGEIDTTDGRDE